jgi:hypothetical protein
MSTFVMFASCARRALFRGLVAASEAVRLQAF